MASSSTHWLPQLAVPMAVGAVLLVATANAQDQQPVSPLTDEHQVLKKDVGVWDTTITVWPEPDAEPVVATAGKRASCCPAACG